jgi:hypothetical protein
MRGYTGVSKSGLQAVTKGDGTFKIDNVPPGKYTLEAWHEKYGKKTQEVTVEAGKPAKVTFKYDGTEKGGESSAQEDPPQECRCSLDLFADCGKVDHLRARPRLRDRRGCGNDCAHGGFAHPGLFEERSFR